MKIFVKKIIPILIAILLLVGSAFGLKMAYQAYQYASYPLNYEDTIAAVSKKYNVDEALICGIIKTESNFNPNAVSQAGAIGIMQVMPATLEWMQYAYRDGEETEKELYNPEFNIDVGTQVMSVLLEYYDGCLETAICAYNAGLGNVDEWLENPEYSHDGKTLDKIPYPETRNYVQRVITNKNMYKTLYFSESE
ncbi:MAG: lytic transglycosylase domain-containing protein [Acutalibacteraceae bacterium]